MYLVDQDNNRILKYEHFGHAQHVHGADQLRLRLITAADEKNEMWSIDVSTKSRPCCSAALKASCSNGRLEAL